MLVNATETSFQKDVLESDIPVLVDFWAEWCGPCKAMAPILESIAAKYEGRVKVVKVDVDENPDLGVAYGIRGIPTLVLFENGKAKSKQTGALPSPKVEAMLTA